MATLKVGDVRKFRHIEYGELDGVVVRVDTRLSLYEVIYIDGTKAQVKFGNIVGPAKLPKGFDRVMKLMAEECAAFNEANELRLKYEQELVARQSHIDNLLNSLRASFDPVAHINRG